jgi:hypothetical protein
MKIYRFVTGTCMPSAELCLEKHDNILNYWCFLTLKSFLFWNINLCSPSKVLRRFGGTYHRHLQCQSLSLARN